MKKRWVIKAGSNMVCTGGPLLLRTWMQQLSVLRRRYNIEVVWVTSGAIAAATERAQRKAGKRRTLAEKQALSAIGQPLVMDLYNLALQATGLLGAQVLLTYDDLANRTRRGNFRNTVEQLLKWDVVPILNENDAVATDEIKFGDNDSLAAKVAGVVEADRLVILTDVIGLCDSDPRTNRSAKLIPNVSRIDSSLLKKVTPAAGSAHGTGGMYSKLLAAKLAAKNGVETWLMKGDTPAVLIESAEGRNLGTVVSSKR
ncbi:MAG: glutamate 5-kinase [Anaerolineae bacterium]|nr:glutamate 5-kinase [Phycisphaerae bacterium]